MSDAILLTSHGTVERADDIPQFLSNIRRGRPASESLIAEVRRRFLEIGGSPLLSISESQAKGLAARLEMKVAVASRLWDPYPRDVLTQLARQGVCRVVSLPMAPYSVHVYHAAVREAAEPLGIELVEVPSWGSDDGLLAVHERMIREGLSACSQPKRTPVLLSAHSLPARVIRLGDPYEHDFRAAAEALKLRFPDHQGFFVTCFQSQGASDEAWIGPDLSTSLRDVRAEGFSEVVVAPIGFVADHIETLYDLDIEARAMSEQIGLRLVRVPAVNANSDFLDVLANLVRRALLGRTH